MFRFTRADRLSAAGDETRGERRLMAATLLAALGCGAVAFSPKPPDRAAEAAAVVRAIGADEARAFANLQAIAAGTREGTLSEADAAARVEREVIPAWRSARARAEAARGGPLAAYVPADLTTYLRLRQESCESLVAAVRSSDPELADRHRVTWQAADRLAPTLRQNLLESAAR